jgi:CRISPR-associated protein Cas1
MQIYLDSYGAFLGVKDKMFFVKPRHSGGKLFAVRNVTSFFLTKGVRVSSDALMLAIAQDIPVLLIDRTARPIGRLWNGRYGSIATIRKNQYKFCESQTGWEWVASVLQNKIKAQRNLVLHLTETEILTAAQKRILQRTVPVLRHSENQFKRWEYIETESPAGTFRGWEGTAGRYYFRAISSILPDDWQFKGRTFRPAEDRFNSLLNYLYGMLYGFTETALLKAGLDPTLGVLHVDRYGGQPTLSFDFIEPYRVWADETALRLILDNVLPLNTFSETTDASEKVNNGWWLQNPGKGKVIEAFLKFMHTRHPRADENRKRAAYIDKDARDLAQKNIRK